MNELICKQVFHWDGIDHIIRVQYNEIIGARCLWHQLAGEPYDMLKALGVNIIRHVYWEVSHAADFFAGFARNFLHGRNIL